MPKRLRSTLITIATQYFALALGYAWGRDSFLAPEFFGSLAIAGFVADSIRILASSRLRRTHIAGVWICGCLAILAGWFMTGGVSLGVWTDEAFVQVVLLLAPFLLAIGPLVRRGACLAVVAAVVFFATCIAMMIYNGFHQQSGVEFFVRWIS